MRQARKEKYFMPKTTRWDRIRKRNTNKTSFGVKSDVLKSFFEKDYITQYDETVLCGEKQQYQILNPALVMDLRHEMFRKIPRKLPLVSVGGQRSLDACVSHNLAVEDRYIKNELNKFRQQLEKNHKRNTFNVKIIEKAEQDVYSVDNNCLIESLERTAKHIEHFYAAPSAALQKVEKLWDFTAKQDYSKDLNFISEEETPTYQKKTETYIEEKESCKPITECIEGIHLVQNNNQYSEEDFKEQYVPQANEIGLINSTSNMSVSVTEITIGDTSQPLASAYQTDMENNHENICQTRAVRFDNSVQVRRFDRANSEFSNTSDGIDSVVSDLAEEALFELQMEAEAKISENMGLHPIHDKSSYTNEFHRIGNPKNYENIINSLVITKLSKPKQDDIEQVISEVTDEESISNHKQNLIIEQLFRPRANRNHTLLRKYFLNWIHFVTIEKFEREDVSSKGDRIHKINLFLDKIRKEKLRLTREARQCNLGHSRGEAPKKPTESTQVTKKYQNKIKMQQDIIDLQRIKLERQERIIMELKLNKLSEEAKEARQDLKNELKTIIQHGDPKFKAKAKCLQLIGNLRDEKDANLTSLEGKAVLMPKFLREMQERALERSIRHEKARQRRLQQEAEKEAQKMAAEDTKRLEDEEAKRRRIDALKEKRRQEKMAKIIKEREHQRALETTRKANEFYRRFLLRRIGMEGFKRLISRKRENKRKCEQFRCKILKRTYFLQWRDSYLKMHKERLILTTELYEKILKRNALSAWIFYLQEERTKFNVAVDWCNLKRTEITFQFWAKYTKYRIEIESAKMNKAKSHHEWHLKWKVLDCWQRLPQILQLERETEERRQRWRMKIWELLPDYTPNRDEHL